MFQVFWPAMPELESLPERLSPWGEVALLGERTLRLIPFDREYPAMYFNRGGSIDILASGVDLFYQNDCIEELQRWLGEALITL